MCSKCDDLASFIEQTRSGYSWVELSFPNGTPRLVTRAEVDPDEGSECIDDC